MKRFTMCAALLVCLCTGTASTASVLSAAAADVQSGSEIVAAVEMQERSLSLSAVAPAAVNLVQKNNMMFDIGSGTAVLLYVEEDKAEIKIPDTVDGLPVTAISAPKDRPAFVGSSIQKIIIPASVTQIQAYQILGDCPSLKAFQVAGGNSSYCDKDGVIYSKDGKTLVLYAPAHGDSYAVPNGTEVIGAYSFAGNKKLKAVTTPASLKTIDRQAFRDCTSLASIDLAKGLEVVASEAFAQCTALNEIILPYSVNTIEHAAFDGCTAADTYILNPDCTIFSSDRTLPKGSGTKVQIHALRESSFASFYVTFWSGRKFCRLDDYKSRFLPVFPKNGGGSGTMEVRYIDQNIGSAALPECDYTAPNGKNFAGWQVGGQLMQPGDEITADSFAATPYEITAVWLAPGERPGSDTSKTQPGDLNNDGSCDKTDAELLLSFLSGRNNSISYPPADLDGDARITAKDLTLLKQMV